MHKVNEINKIPLIVFDINDEIKHIIMTELKNILLSQKNQMQNDNIYLCPYCLFLFKETQKNIKKIDDKYFPENLKQNNVYRDPNPLEE